MTNNSTKKRNRKKHNNNNKNTFFFFKKKQHMNIIQMNEGNYNTFEQHIEKEHKIKGKQQKHMNK